MNKVLLSKLNELKEIAKVDTTIFHDWDNINNCKKDNLCPDKVELKRIYETKNFARHIMTIPPKAKTELHRHGFVERCKVLAGSMKDLVKGTQVNINGEIIYSKGEKHQQYNPSATEPCIMVVDFHK